MKFDGLSYFDNDEFLNRSTVYRETNVKNNS